MKLKELKSILGKVKTINFALPSGDLVESHFHITEVGKVHKHFVDCGGTERKEDIISLQLWSANDYDHRLNPDKLLNIIELSEKMLKLPDLDIEVEYQGDTIQRFKLDFEGDNFLLQSTQTDCLAKDACGIPEKPKLDLASMISSNNNDKCTPGGGCC